MSPTMKEIVNADNIIEKHVNLTNQDKKTIEEVLSTIKRNALYNSKIHGLYHSEKVFLFSYLIAKHERLDEIDHQIITDAALYHDIGRINDYEDSLHGYCSANRIDTVVKHPIYKDIENLNILKAIMDGHSVSDERRDRFIDDYEITDVERYYKLYDILKDADALDRKRFFDYSDSYLDERFLRIDVSKGLIKLSEEINNIYKQNIKTNVNNIKRPEVGRFQCFHSIGFDFFKLASVLEHGILSKKEMQKLDIEGVSNFEGGNLDDYVSVVDGRLINKGGTAFPTFVMNGISFVCEVDKLYSSDEKNTQSYCIEHGIPYNKSLHDDEKYVYSRIDSDQINHIFLSNKVCNKDVREGLYIYNSLSFSILKDRINHYINNISDVINPDLSEMNKLLSMYKKTLEDYFVLDQIQKNKVNKQVVAKLEGYRIKINNIIQDWIYQKYQYELGKNKDEIITIDDIVSHELQKLGFEYNKSQTDKGYLFSYEKIKTKSR